MATEGRSIAGGQSTDERPRSVFDLPGNFFDSSCLIPPGKQLQFQPPISNASSSSLLPNVEETLNNRKEKTKEVNVDVNMNRWSCNTCQAEFESLIDQRSHFKSDLHRFNVKLSLAGKNIVKEEDLDQLGSDSFPKDFDVSSISGSENEDERGSRSGNDMKEALDQSIKQKIFVRLCSGERVYMWKCLVLKDSEIVSYENDQLVIIDEDGHGPRLREVDVIEQLKVLIREPRDNTQLRVVLLASGGHFAGCVFDGNTVVAHKTFHRYVVRAKAGKRQSSKDASGKSIHSAGASLRRYNELALKKDIQELLASWKPYFDASSCVFIYAPSSNRQLFYNGEKPLFSDQRCNARNIPFAVRRPTFKEAQRIYGLLSQIAFEVDEEQFPDINHLKLKESCMSNEKPMSEDKNDERMVGKMAETCESVKISNEQSTSGESDQEVIGSTTPLHEAAKSDNSERVLELLEQGLNPTLKDERGKTPYMLATDKEVRNAFRRFMASNIEMWDWHAANVPSALTKEMEESQAAKQAEKDAKRKARAKELKKLRRAREKKTQAQAAEPQNVGAVSEKAAASSSVVKSTQSGLSGTAARLSKEEELKRKQDEEREKRAAAAERRIALVTAAAATQGASTTVAPSTTQTKRGDGTDVLCSCCNASLAGKVPFHRYNYKYCSTTCMHVHREFLEDG